MPAGRGLCDLDDFGEALALAPPPLAPPRAPPTAEGAQAPATWAPVDFALGSSGAAGRLLVKALTAWRAGHLYQRRLDAEGRRATEAQGLLRRRAVADVGADAERLQHAVLRAWKAASSSSSPAPRAEHQKALRRAVVAEERGAARALQVAQHASRRHLVAAVVAWRAALHLQQREAARRQRTLHAEVCFATELHRVRAAGAKLADELRRQRRAHGVAAIHASMDRRMQAVLHAWYAGTRERQREALHKSQLDIAAAEAAAGCAVLRMEGRRSALELKRKWRAESLRVEAARSQQFQRSVLVAWASLGRASRRELLAAQLAASRAEVGRQAWQLARWQEALCTSRERSRRARCAGEAFRAWFLAVSFDGGGTTVTAALEPPPAAAAADEAAHEAASSVAAASADTAGVAEGF
ncbi:unnamed protein product [Prorocentrum cordatum]|uniref:Protein of centriole 5 n=1 Tax=Prorocentrum cordatum TaxID=2364126 RepID=A0ABN9REE1_9DINO|nr:unnamed protein product [Polarella glacialis]